MIEYKKAHSMLREQQRACLNHGCVSIFAIQYFSTSVEINKEELYVFL